MSKAKNSELRVGLFVAALIVVGGAMLFVVGGSADLLQKRYTLHAKWADIQGLVPGATVRLAGYDVGEVSNIKFSGSLSERLMWVEMKVKIEYQPRIREDSVARIDSVGVLGDKIISLSMGSPENAVLADGDEIMAEAPLDLASNMQKISGILDKTHNIGRKVDLMLGDDQEAAKASLARSFDHLEALLYETQHGSGMVHALVYDKELASWIEYGASPRATIGLDRCARAHAWLLGRDFVSPDDVKAMAYDVLRHRLVVSYDGEIAGVTADDEIDRLLDLVPVA